MQPDAFEIRGVTKRFPGVLANDRVSLRVGSGEVRALLGENGAGKSTLMNTLYGLYQPDEGEIFVGGVPVKFQSPRDAIQAGIGMIHQEFMLVRPLTVVENVVLGLRNGSGGIVDLAAAAKKISSLSEQYGLSVDPWARIDQLTVGAQQRIEILKLLYRNASILILDEPTAVLTPQESEKLLSNLKTLAADGRTIVIVTHKLQEILSASDRVTIMRDGRVVDTVERKDANESLLASLMVGREVILKAQLAPVERGEEILRVENLHVPGASGDEVVKGVDLSVRGGEIVGIAGVDGNGQSELVEAIVGLRTKGQGNILLKDKEIGLLSVAQRTERGLAYVPADRRNIGSVTELGIDLNSIVGTQKNFTKAWGLLLDRNRIAEHARRLVQRFGVRTPGIEMAAGKLSGGNLQKLIIGREILKSPDMLIVEQPTRGLDVGAIEAVWAELLAVRQQKKAILLISADLEEIRNLSDRILVMYSGKIVGELEARDYSNELVGAMMAGISAGKPLREHAV